MSFEVGNRRPPIAFDDPLEAARAAREEAARKAALEAIAETKRESQSTQIQSFTKPDLSDSRVDQPGIEQVLSKEDKDNKDNLRFSLGQSLNTQSEKPPEPVQLADAGTGWLQYLPAPNLPTPEDLSNIGQGSKDLLKRGLDTLAQGAIFNADPKIRENAFGKILEEKQPDLPPQLRSMVAGVLANAGGAKADADTRNKTYSELRTALEAKDGKPVDPMAAFSNLPESAKQALFTSLQEKYPELIPDAKTLQAINTLGSARKETLGTDGADASDVVALAAQASLGKDGQKALSEVTTKTINGITGTAYAKAEQGALDGASFVYNNPKAARNAGMISGWERTKIGFGKAFAPGSTWQTVYGEARNKAYGMANQAIANSQRNLSNDGDFQRIAEAGVLAEFNKPENRSQLGLGEVKTSHSHEDAMTYFSGLASKPIDAKTAKEAADYALALDADKLAKNVEADLKKNSTDYGTDLSKEMRASLDGIHNLMEYSRQNDARNFDREFMQREVAQAKDTVQRYIDGAAASLGLTKTIPLEALEKADLSNPMSILSQLKDGKIATRDLMTSATALSGDAAKKYGDTSNFNFYELKSGDQKYIAYTSKNGSSSGYAKPGAQWTALDASAKQAVGLASKQEGTVNIAENFRNERRASDYIESLADSKTKDMLSDLYKRGIVSAGQINNKDNKFAAVQDANGAWRLGYTVDDKAEAAGKKFAYHNGQYWAYQSESQSKNYLESRAQNETLIADAETNKQKALAESMDELVNNPSNYFADQRKIANFTEKFKGLTLAPSNPTAQFDYYTGKNGVYVVQNKTNPSDVRVYVPSGTASDGEWKKLTAVDHNQQLQLAALKPFIKEMTRPQVPLVAELEPSK